jgi:AraC family transcriptional regulator
VQLDKHFHDHAVIGVMLSGGFQVRMSGRVRSCEASAVFTEPAGESHSNTIGRTGARIVVVQPDVDPGLPRAISQLFDNAVHFRDGRVSMLASRLADELGMVDDLAPLAIEGLALELLARVGRWAPPKPTPPPWLRRVEDLIHDRFLEPIQIEDLAREADVHPAHLARVFRRHYRVSLACYIRNLRIGWAVERLTGSNESLSSMAFRSGFADQSHFTRTFRAQIGLTPGAYRRLYHGSRWSQSQLGEHVDPGL